MSKPLVIHVIQTQLIAMTEQNARARPGQHRGIGKAGHPAALQKTIPRQKVTIADHEEQRSNFGRFTQHSRAFGFKAAGLIQSVVTDPDLKQVTQNEHSIRLRALQVVAP